MRQSIPITALSPSSMYLHQEEHQEDPGCWLALLTQWLFEQAEITAGMQVLDIGSSAGEVARLLAALVGPTGSVVSVELHPALLESARKQVRAAGLTNVSWCASVSHALAGEQTFDAVVGRNCLLYLSDLPAIVGQCLEHLRPGGVVVFQEVDRSVREQLDHLLASPALGEHGLFWMTGRQGREYTEMHLGGIFPSAAPAPFVATKEEQQIGQAAETPLKLCEYGIGEIARAVTHALEESRASQCEEHTLRPHYFMTGVYARKLA